MPPWELIAAWSAALILLDLLNEGERESLIINIWRKWRL